MSNPLYQQMQGQSPAGNNFLQKFMQFKNGFSGDAKTQVEQLLRSGRISQAQYDQAVRTAQQLQKMLGGR